MWPVPRRRARRSLRETKDRWQRNCSAYYDVGPLASFRRKMHIGYFYDDGRESARGRLAVFRDINFKEDRYFAFFGSSDFNVGKKRSRFLKG